MPELNWLGDRKAKLAARQVPYRLLQPVEQVGDPASDNLLIQGDNLDALKSLLPLYAGRVKCIFIDPPYNTKSAFEHYDDNLEHSQWLSMMYPRLELLRELLAEDGSIWVTIDDNEGHYLKVMMDELFSRDCFIADIAWKRRDGAPNDRKIGSTYDHVLIYSKGRTGGAKKTRAEEAFNLMERTEKADSQYRVYEPFGFDDRGPFRNDSNGNAKGGRFVQSLMYPVTNPFTGKEVFPRKGRCWVYKEEDMLKMIAERRFFWGKDGKAGTPMRKLFKSEAKSGMTAPTIWDDVGLNQHAAREIEILFGEKASFETPKPEGLLKRVIEIATNPDDLVLDSFLGSGTTAAVAHKMGRRWIGIEMGEHARTHCLPRLSKVVEGEQGGISQAVNWQGGGGFRFMQLGEPVFEQDGRIAASVRFAPLAAYLWFVETRRPWHGGTSADGCPARRIPCLTPWLDAVDEAEREGSPLPSRPMPAPTPLLGVHGETAIVLLYNGILGDRRPQGGNVLTHAVWDDIRVLLPDHTGPWLVYGEASRLQPATRKHLNIEFKQIPYDIRVR